MVGIFIKEYDQYIVDMYGSVFSLISNKQLKQSPDSTGYPRVNLSKNGKQTVIRIHRLVAEAFISNPENKPCVNHKNGIKSDNRVDNLEWCTYSENNQHAYDTGLIAKGENHYLAKLSNDQVKEIRELRASTNLSQSKMGLMYGVSREHIRDIINYKRRK